MQPSKPTAAERRVILWLFTALGIAAVAYIGYSAWVKSRACESACLVAGADGGDLRLHGGTRITMGTHCECSGGGAVDLSE